MNVTTLLKLATYNIHGSVGTDGRFDPARTMAVINQLDADIIALQEVSTIRSDLREWVSGFQAETGMRVIPGMTMFRDAAHYGNVVLTRDAVEHVEHINLSFKQREPRGAICLTLSVDDRRICIVATHLGLRAAERRAQVKLLLKVLERRPADIFVLMGDLNEWIAGARSLRQARRFFDHIHTPSTFPARFPLLSLDRILVWPATCLHTIAPLKNPLTKIASDHLPLRAEIVF
ncbi:endonuclease/exonuclease/phosphatase family protein [Desulfosudis oleivorans]|uniref:Endonuclease/exonuclease/phosphatase n=1 Tax=Desulfosudis oleivorans (strain DSM 6200 / JCM 39069 / Hxd3) TaxID=96561 RepID=A8ZW90_DESOH|nr:endonuclease/exonuclease/phosphatase family protein [Desulfosudis oleivorans]ABW68324.1 Endonuclease/exonuclease/phosphatase [Desulfosudis oleivorans Hxd3]